MKVMAARTPGRRDPAYQGYLLLRNCLRRGADRLGPGQVLQHPGRLEGLPRSVDRPHHARNGTGVHVLRGRGRNAAGIVVLISPKWGSLLVAGWLGGIVANLLTTEPPEYYDIALRDFGLMLGALTLNRLTIACDDRSGAAPRAPARGVMSTCRSRVQRGPKFPGGDRHGCDQSEAGTSAG